MAHNSKYPEFDDEKLTKTDNIIVAKFDSNRDIKVSELDVWALSFFIL